MEFIFEYGMFLAKVLTVVFGILGVLITAVSLLNKQSDSKKGVLEINQLNEQYENMSETLLLSSLNSHEQKLKLKELREGKKKKSKSEKLLAKSSKHDIKPKKKVYIIDFNGDVRATEVDNLREEVTAITTQASSSDEVVVRLESGGGTVHGYGLAASQLDRLKKKGIALTVCVDKVAASGGYAMACVADQILAAPFAMIGSIGVVAQLPNFNRLMKKNDIDFEMLTAGEYKRTLTLFGENTQKGREKFVEDLEDIHDLFKEYVHERRPAMDMASVATGEVWLGARAKELNLVDSIQTSDEYIGDCIDESDVFEIKYVIKKSLIDRLGIAAETSLDRLFSKWWARLTQGTERSF